MNVRELINELIQYDLDWDIEIEAGDLVEIIGTNKMIYGRKVVTLEPKTILYTDADVQILKKESYQDGYKKGVDDGHAEGYQKGYETVIEIDTN